jgi:hypothetical protein
MNASLPAQHTTNSIHQAKRKPRPVTANSIFADHNMHANLQARASEKQITEQAKRNSIQLAGKAFIAIAQLTANKREP